MLPLSQSGSGSNGNEGALHIPQSSSITGTSSSNCLVSYPGRSLGETYNLAEVNLMYSAAPADWGGEGRKKEKGEERKKRGKKEKGERRKKEKGERRKKEKGGKGKKEKGGKGKKEKME